MHRRWMLLLSLAWLLIGTRSAEEVHPTPTSVLFWGRNSTLDGQLLPTDGVVRAYDPTGVLAGCYDPGGLMTGCQTDPKPPGWYVMPVYGDDHGPTSDIDEGADPGDRIAFTVNGHQALPAEPDLDPVWTGNGDQANVELRACTLPGDFDCDCGVTVADLMRQAQSFGVSRGWAGYYPPFDRNGDDHIDSPDIQQVAAGWRATCPE